MHCSDDGCSDDQFNRAFKYFTKKNQRASFVTSNSPYRECEKRFPTKIKSDEDEKEQDEKDQKADNPLQCIRQPSS